MSKDSNVPWPDGSWLTWNEETESWEKHEGPSPEEGVSRKTPTTPTAEKAGTKPAVSGKATTRKKTTAKKTTGSRGAAKKGASWEPSAEAGRKPSTPPPARSRATISTETSAWRPVAEGVAPAAIARAASARAASAPKPVPVRADAPVAARERPRPGREPGEASILPAIVSGCVVGVLAGYFLSFLIR